MSTAMTMAPSPAPHDRPSYPSEILRDELESSASMQRPAAPLLPPPPPSQQTDHQPEPLSHESPATSLPAAAESSPLSQSRLPGPKIIVKKEPGSPDNHVYERRRPKNLDLSKGTALGQAGPGTGRPLTAREGGLGIQEVGLACLSPGFSTHDPYREQKLKASVLIRDQQRHIIASRQHQSVKGDAPLDGNAREATAGIYAFAAKTPGMLSRRNKVPPGLSIIAPSHEQFAHERVIQSAPLGQTFTGRHNPQPLTRHLAHQGSHLSSTSHIHHVPATQTNNRLPPISDVFGQGIPGSGHPEPGPPRTHTLYHGHNPAPPHTSRAPPPPPPLASPSPHAGHPAAAAAALGPAPTPTPSRPREYKSAEEAQAELTGGRADLLPKLVHYSGSAHPPTPPTPRAAEGMRSTSAGRRRGRAEYEEGVSPPLGHGPAPTRRGPFGAGRDSPETQQAKKEEFLQLCARAWDLFHS